MLVDLLVRHVAQHSGLFWRDDPPPFPWPPLVARTTKWIPAVTGSGPGYWLVLALDRYYTFPDQ